MSAPINVENLFSVKGMVALVTGGGTGTAPFHHLTYLLIALTLLPQASA